MPVGLQAVNCEWMEGMTMPEGSAFPGRTAFSAMLLFLAAGCGSDDATGPSGENTVYRQEMRSFVMELSSWAKGQQPGFIVIPQNGQELVTDNGDPGGTPQIAYLASMDATGREDMFYGYVSDNVPTPASEAEYLRDLCLVCGNNGVQVLATDYCWTEEYVDDSYQTNEQYGFISFAADQRELNTIPGYPSEPWNVNADAVADIDHAANFLYLINGENYGTKQQFIDAVAQTSYDVVIMDLFHNEEQFTQADLDQIRVKSGGGERLLICYVSIGEAEDYRYYWDPLWDTQKPSWLGNENPDWPGNYKVEYWDPEWQAIIFGNDDSYLQRIIDAGFDGAYLDIIDAFEYFENL